MIQSSLILKVITAGDGGVGKTSMLRRHIEGKFSFDTKMTIGVEIFHKVVSLKDGNVCSLQLWDFGGQERFRFLLDNFALSASGAFLMYDLTDKKTFKNLPEWERIVRKYDSTLPILLLGSKYDLEDHIEVNDDSALEFVERYKISGFYKVSSKTGYNIDEVFETLTNIIISEKIKRSMNQSVEI
ncbi:MAG: Rab family GTPase [Promethearchaeota archaeon]